MNKLRKIKLFKVFEGWELFNEALGHNNVELTKDGIFQLRDSILIADEIGRVNSRTKEMISENTWAKKEFLIEDADLNWAQLCLYTFCEQGDGAPLYAEVNGHQIKFDWKEKREYWEDSWQLISIPVEYLRKGVNEFIFHSPKGVVWNLWIENSRWPNRSAKSVDWGQTWDYDHMGANGSCDGEYMVRLRLGRYAGEGWIESPYIDISTLASGKQIGVLGILRELDLKYEKLEPEGTEIKLEARIGSKPSYEAHYWTAWKPIEALKAERCFGDPSYHYLQWRAILHTDKTRQTPKLISVSISGALELDNTNWVNAVRVEEWRNEKIIRGSYPFAHQRFEESRLKILRDRYELDWVVKPAKTEFEKYVRLRDWARQQWEDGWKKAVNWGGRKGHIDYCPPWDSLVILELAKRKLSLGMCTHYSTVFVHFCTSLGLIARTVIKRSHCVAEVWSNEFKKWILMDVGGDTDDSRKGTFHYERDGVPLNALELHKAWFRKKFDDIRVFPDTVMREPNPAFKSVMERLKLFDRFCVTLRNDELTSLEPGEPEHGVMSYHYDGYLWWMDEEKPHLWFSLQTDREADLYWTLNQTEIHLNCLGEEPTLNVELENSMPNFAKYLAKFDEDEWVEKSCSFKWKLHEGLNILRVKAVNKFGIEGIESLVKLDYDTYL